MRTVGLRTRPVCDEKKSVFVLVLVLVLQVWCCVVTRSCHAHRHNLSWRRQQLFKYYLYFLYSVLGTSLLWRSTVPFTYLKVKSVKCLCLIPVALVLVVVLRIWSRSHHCQMMCGMYMSFKNIEPPGHAPIGIWVWLTHNIIHTEIRQENGPIALGVRYQSRSSKEIWIYRVQRPMASCDR